MAQAKQTPAPRLHPAIEFSVWGIILALGVWGVIKSQRHVGSFGDWLQIGVALMGSAASLWRLRSGDGETK